MLHENSQEQSIYRALAGQIQSGFYDGGEHFPTVQEIALKYGVSYCPAQRALKALEQEGLIRLCRGKSTKVLKKPYESYLDSGVFRQRAPVLRDLNHSLSVISASIGFAGMLQAYKAGLSPQELAEAEGTNRGKRLYLIFDRSLNALGNGLIQSLYHDVNSVAQSAWLELLELRLGKQGAEQLLQTMAEGCLQSLRECGEDKAAAHRRLQGLARDFYGVMEPYFEERGIPCGGTEAPPFVWEPEKGRTKYCDSIAIDLVCKINQGIYPVGALLPNCTVLADVYHVSVITMRRSLALLNRLGIAQTVNGLGTRAVFAGDSSLVYKLKDLMLDDSLKVFLESLQLLAITCGDVLCCTLPHLTEPVRAELLDAVRIGEEKRALNAVIGACMQAVVRCCPYLAIREIYGKLTLLLLKGSVLRLGETGGERVPGWAEWSAKFRNSLEQNNACGFSAAFREVAVGCFLHTKRRLLEIGVAGAAEVAGEFPAAGETPF